MEEGVDLGTIGQHLHQRLLAGDVTASAEIAEIFLPAIVQILRKQFPGISDQDLIDMAAADTLVSYLDRPHQYDPGRLPIDRYFTMSARGDLLNLLRKDAKLNTFGKSQVVELDDPDSEYIERVKDTSLSVEDTIAVLTSPVWKMLNNVLPDPIDREMAKMMLEGVRETLEYSRCLSIAHLSKAEQEKQTKRHKDRIKKVLLRHINRSDLDAI